MRSAVPEPSAGLEGEIQFATSDLAKTGYGASPHRFDSREEQLAFYGGYDVDDPETLIAWQTGLIQEISPKGDHGISTHRLPSSSS
ncbi:hypothetical protein N7501_005117 [Penicillium viridicatum]|nr:hypothetical protein N7501_005117 [Penicillium viridicatum]